MMSKERQKYLNYLTSTKWKKKRQLALAHYNHQCARCKRTYLLEVHHLSYDRLGREHMKDLLVLCRECHIEEHERPKYNPNTKPNLCEKCLAGESLCCKMTKRRPKPHILFKEE